MSSRKGKKSYNRQIQLEEFNNDSEYNDSQFLADENNYDNSLRCSKRLSAKKTPKITITRDTLSRTQDNSLNNSYEDVRKQHKILKKPISDGFGYDVKEQDIYYLHDFFIELPKLKDIWKRIGFNNDIQQKRLETLYEKLIETFHDIVENEEVLESNILESIEEQRLLIGELCLELSIKPSELKLKQGNSVLEEDEILRAELKNLEAEKYKRLDEYNKLVIVENEVSIKLCMDPIEKRHTVPSQKMLNEISARITELTQLCKERKEEMSELKEQVMHLYEDLEMSRSDSFTELIVMESVDEIPLGADDVKRTQELRDELRHKDNLIIAEIKSLRSKIKELWTKLNIGNESVYDMVMSEEFTDSKRNMITSLREEHDTCVQVKMANMQKFIESVRIEIREYLVKMFVGPKELKELDKGLLMLEDYTEDLLTLHENKKEELEFCYAESQQLFEKSAKWIKLWADFIEFEEKTKDPARLKVRGHNLLVEEKQRKTFNTHLPKLEADLSKHAEEYATENDRKEFTINGLYYLEFIQRKKQDHEESKMNERKEKQLMKDNMKRNESRYGSKPITPLAIRNKRKLLTTHHEASHIVTPSRMRNHKLMKTESTPGTTILGGSSRLGSNIKISKPVSKPGLQPKLSVASKRKSKTPAKNRFRKSVKGKLNYDNTINETIKDKSTGMTSSSSYQTINSTAGSNSSRLVTSTSRQGLATSRINSGIQKKTMPPQSASAKYSAATLRIDRQSHVMQSTASSTFIEEENFENIENIDKTVIDEKKKEKTSQKSLKFGANKFNFDSSKLNTPDINYNDFSRDLVKMQGSLKENLSRFGSTPSTLGDRTNTSTFSTKYSTRSGKNAGANSNEAQSEKEKLTSTLLMTN